MIVIPVDHFATKKELCSSACLDAVKCRMPEFTCKMCCNRGNVSEFFFFFFFVIITHTFGLTFSFVLQYTFRRTVNGLELIFCGEDCFMNYHQTNGLPVAFCDTCGSLCPKKHLVLKLEGLKTFCGEDCLHTFKEVTRANRNLLKNAKLSNV